VDGLAEVVGVAVEPPSPIKGEAVPVTDEPALGPTPAALFFAAHAGASRARIPSATAKRSGS